jgi:hypothetical protein
MLIGAFLNKSRYTKLLTCSFVLVMFGVGAMVVFSWWGGLGGRSGHSIWWALFVAPYPIGWLSAQITAVLTLVESWKTAQVGLQRVRGRRSIVRAKSHA